MFVQDGWCARVEPSRPYVIDGTGAPKNWDVRADWRAADPRCSAIATGPYLTDEEFPVWFFNLPSATTGQPAAPEDLPPLAVTRLAMHATIRNDTPGVFQVRTSANVAAELIVDGRAADAGGARLDPGSHDVAITATLRETGWRLEPLWNGDDAFAALPASIAPPSAIDRAFKPWAQWIPFVLVGLLVVMGAASLWQQIAAWEVAAWIAVSIAAAAPSPVGAAALLALHDVRAPGRGACAAARIVPQRARRVHPAGAGLAGVACRRYLPRHRLQPHAVVGGGQRLVARSNATPTASTCRGSGSKAARSP